MTFTGCADMDPNAAELLERLTPAPHLDCYTDQELENALVNVTLYCFEDPTTSGFTKWPVPEKLKHLVDTVSRCCFVAEVSTAIRDQEKYAKRILWAKRSALEEVDHAVQLLSDREYREYCEEAMK